MNQKMKLYQTAFHQCQTVFSNTRTPDRHFCLCALPTEIYSDKVPLTLPVLNDIHAFVP